MVGSIWSAVVGWILLRRYLMMVRFLDDLGVPILMGQERTVNSAADLVQRGRVRLALPTCRVLVSGRLARTLIAPRSCLMREGSRRSLVLVALAARAVDARPDRVGSETLVGMARTSVWRLLL
jgi:hypothetical protein